MSAARIHAYKLLAELLEYPTARTAATAKLCAVFLESRSPAAADAIRLFAKAVDHRDVRDMEERYAAVFDFNPARTLDLGYQLFGETYKRGVFLVKMKESVLAHELDAGAELPDHLPTVLRLLADLAPEEEPKDLAEEVILPCVEKVLRSFEDDAGGYRSVLAGVKALLMADFGVTHVEPPRGMMEEPASSTGFKLPMFPGFNPPVERVLS